VTYWELEFNLDADRAAFPDDVVGVPHLPAQPVSERDGLWDANACPTCWGALVDGQCFKCDHGCPKCRHPLSREFECVMCGTVAFRCAGAGCACGAVTEPVSVPDAPFPTDEFAPAAIDEAA